MRFQRIAKETTSSGKLWEGFMPEETKAHIAEQAEALVKPISDGRLDRPLLSAVASFLHYPAMASLSRLAYLTVWAHCDMRGGVFSPVLRSRPSTSLASA